MNTHLRSDNVSLRFGESWSWNNTLNALWQTFRRTAVEPAQSSSPDFTSFADECLLCARIVLNESTTAENEDDDSLWDPLFPAESPQGPPSSPSTTLTPGAPAQIAGLIYLYAGPGNLPAGEANIGVIMESSMQCRGYAREAVQLVLRWAFEELKFHRVQAPILDTAFKDRAMRLFIGSGFAHEGTKRRAVFQPEGEGMAGLWKDVTYLAMLDTDWTVKSTWMRANRPSPPPVPSAWDEMFARHAKEREALLQWEEKHGRMKRTSSTETLKEGRGNAVQDLAYLTDDATSFSGSSPPSPRPNLVVTWEEDSHMADDLGPNESRQSWEEVIETSLAARRHRLWLGSSSPNPSLQGHMLALPSIPSIGRSERNPQSPLTIPSPSTPGSTPPFSPSPSPAPSSVHDTWPDFDDEDEDDWLPSRDLAPTNVPIPFTMPDDPHVRTDSAGFRFRSSSVASSSADSWSDAQSSVGGSSSSWDVVSNASDL